MKTKPIDVNKIEFYWLCFTSCNSTRVFQSKTVSTVFTNYKATCCSLYKFKLTLQTPQATVHSSLVAEAWLAWHSMQRSIIWLRQMAQLSTTISENKMPLKFLDMAINTTSKNIEKNFVWTHPKPTMRQRSTEKVEQIFIRQTSKIQKEKRIEERVTKRKRG